MCLVLTLSVLGVTRQKFCFRFFSRSLIYYFVGSFPSNPGNFKHSVSCNKILGTLPIDVLRGMSWPRKNGGRLEKPIIWIILKFFFAILKIVFFSNDLHFFAVNSYSTPQNVDEEGLQNFFLTN